MAVLEWDRVGERFFETGIDRGVLFTSYGSLYGSSHGPDGNAFVWNGLTNVAENTNSEIKSYYIDGSKYLDCHVPGAYSAKLEAFTYPDILDDLTGCAVFAPGVYLHDQRARVFHLSYRTGVGNDVDSELGHKIHIIYNVMAKPSGAAMATIGENVDPGKFSWDLTGTPPVMFGVRPTSHIHLDTRYLSPAVLDSVEDLLYGTTTTNPSLPSMTDLLSLLEATY